MSGGFLKIIDYQSKLSEPVLFLLALYVALFDVLCPHIFITKQKQGNQRFYSNIKALVCQQQIPLILSYNV